MYMVYVKHFSTSLKSYVVRHTPKTYFNLLTTKKILNVFFNGNKLEQVTSEKLLGVTIDESLSWKQQI